jgi:peptidoglycan hydrolase CwlO-like protein
MPFVMNQDIPETYEELKQAFVAECKERYENNEHSRQLLRELNGENANLEREKEELEEEVSLINSEEMENEELIGELKAQIKELQEEVDRLKKMFCYSAVDMK